MSGKATATLLESVGVDPRDLDAIFITHEHIDHIKGAGILSRRYDIPIYANEETWQAMERALGAIDSKNIKEFRIEDSFYFKDIFVRPVPIFHDAINPNGYTFQTEQSKFSLITDTGWVSDSIIESIKDSDVYYLESNHDLDMLKNGPYSWALKQRVLSTKGHLSNENCSKVVETLLKGKGEALILSHLSVENNTPKLAYENMKKTIDKIGLAVEEGVISLEVAPRYIAGTVYDYRGKK